MESNYNLVPNVPQAIFESHLNIIMSNDEECKPNFCTHQYQPEYYEVEILRDKIEGNDLLEKNMDDILNLNKYTCHLCNIEVPKTYMKEHNHSPKHKTCNEIANLALERTKLQMQIDITTTRKVEVLEAYFCKSCSAVVLNSEKERHETSKIHKVSLKHDKQLDDLVKIYSDISNVEVDSEVDDLESLRQRIELESVLDESEINTESDENETERLYLRKVLDDLKIDFKNTIKSAMHSFTTYLESSAGDPLLLLNKIEDGLKIITAKSNDFEKQLRKYERKKIEDNITKLKDRIDDLTSRSDLVVKCLPANQVASVEIKKTDAPLTQADKKINKIMAKYFGTYCTVNALKNNGEIESHTDIDTKETNKKKNKKEKKLKQKEKKRIQKMDCKKQNLDNKQQNLDNKKQNTDVKKQNVDNAKQNIDNTKQNVDNAKQNIDDNKKQNMDNKDQNTDNKKQTVSKEDKKDNAKDNAKSENIPNNQPKINNEQNNNKNTEQNKNKDIKRKKNKDRNTKAIDLEEINSRPNKVLQRNHTPGFNLVYYLKDISRRCEIQPIHTVEAFTDNIVQITAINGDKFKVLVNNFHSFHMKSNDIFCKVCQTPNVRRPEWHIIEHEHRAKVMVPIKDCNGIRQLDDIWSHCMLCNDLIKDVEFHLESLLHKNKIKQCLVELGKKNLHSDVEDNLENSTEKDTNDIDAITSLILRNNLAMTSHNSVTCNLCDLTVKYNLKDIQRHMNSFQHLNNIEQKQKENKLIELDSDRVYCIGCDVNFSNLDIISHCNGKRHGKLLQELVVKERDKLISETAVLSSVSHIKMQSKGKIEDNELICFVCNVILTSIDKHMDSFEHKKNYYAYLEANKLNEVEPDTFYCIPCNIIITIDYLMSHCTSKKHRLALKKVYGIVENQALMDIETQATQETTDDDQVMPLKVLYQFRETSERMLICTVCYEEVPYIRKPAEYHVSTLDHVVAFNLMMLWNKIKKRDDKYYCDICRSDMTYFSEITHVLGKQHVGNLAKESKGTVYEYDRTLVTHAYAMSHKVGNRTRPSSIVCVKK